MLRWGGCEERGRDESTTCEHVGGGGVREEEGAELRDGVGRGLLVGGRGKVPIETNRAIPTLGGASRADFAKVS